jgi:Zn-dependent M28 family amino/carboxypeptidase
VHLIPTVPQPRSRSFLLAAAVLAVASAAPAQLADDRAAGAALVTLDECKKWLGTLAGPEFEGRGTGQPGYEKAANYVAAHFKALGLEARGENGSYFQHMPWSVTAIVPEQSFVRFHKDGAELLRIPAERLAGQVSDALTARGDCVLLAVDVPAAVERAAGGGGGQGRRGFEMPAIAGLDDLELGGKVVIVWLRQQGERANPMGSFAVTQKLQGKGAAAVLFAQDTAPAGGLIGRRGAGRRGPGANPAAGGVARMPAQPQFGGADFDKLLGGLGMTRDSLATAATMTPLAITAEVSLVIEDKNGPAMNVFAVLPGSDPVKKDEYVVIGSHLDHLGKSGDVIRPGADDDASGTTGVMAVAQMLAKNRVRPARSVLFVCFAGEENGLRGSAHFADNPPIPLASIVAELQMDMIGRDEEESVEDRGSGEKAEDNRNSLHLVGTQKLAPSLHELCMGRNATAKFDLEFDHEGMFGRSDHANFAKKGVPVAFFFTGLHRDYHQPSDTPDKIHYEKLLRVATYVYDIAFELAVQPGRPAIAPELWTRFRAGSRGAPEQPAAPLLEAQPGK